MRGFKIIAKSEKGEECILRDIDANKKVLETITVKEKPFLELNFLIRRTAAGRMLKKTFDLIKNEEAIKHISNKMLDLGAEEGKDYTVSVIV